MTPTSTLSEVDLSIMSLFKALRGPKTSLEEIPNGRVLKLRVILRRADRALKEEMEGRGVVGCTKAVEALESLPDSRVLTIGEGVGVG